MAQTNQTDYTYVASGSPDFLVPFPYLSTSEVEVTVDGAPTGVIWTALNSVQLSPTPAVGAAVRVRRNTDARAVRNDFSAGAPFSPRNINENNAQLLYAVEEAVNETAGTAADALATASNAVQIANGAVQVANDAAAQIDAALADSAATLRTDLAGSGSGAGSNLIGHRGLTVDVVLDSKVGVFDAVADLRLLVGYPNQQVVVTSYYAGWAAEAVFIGPRGGGRFVWDDTSTAADNGVTVFAVAGVATGRWRRVHGGTVSLWDAGCVTTPGEDNRDRIFAALYSGARKVHVPPYQFDSRALQIGTQANGVTLEGEGVDSCLSLIGTQLTACALVHIPKVGDAYGGTVAGAQNFSLDKLRLRGDQASGTVSTTGLVATDAVNLQVGTLWTHGFYKSGMLLGGAPTRIHVGKLYSWDNGNQPTANTGGQGFAIVSDTVDYPAIHIGFAECWDNGINNFGQGLDMVRGNFTAGTFLFHDNGGSGCKVVNLTKGKIDKLVIQRNNRHVGQTFGGLYTNGDFGELDIGVMESDSPAGSGLSFVHTGTIRIGRYRASSCPASGITTAITAGKVARLEIGQAEISGCTGPAALLGGSAGDMTVVIGSALVRDGVGSAQGINANPAPKSVHIGRLESRAIGGSALFVGGTPSSFFVGELIGNGSVSTGAMATINSGVTGAVILSARRSGTYGTTLTDNGTNTYKPNVI